MSLTSACTQSAYAHYLSGAYKCVGSMYPTNHYRWFQKGNYASPPDFFTGTSWNCLWTALSLPQRWLISWHNYKESTRNTIINVIAKTDQGRDSHYDDLMWFCAINRYIYFQSAAYVCCGSWASQQRALQSMVRRPYQPPELHIFLSNCFISLTIGIWHTGIAWTIRFQMWKLSWR